MIAGKPYLLFIEPTKPPEDPIDDELVDTMRKLLTLGLVVDPRMWYRGVHTCTGCKHYSISSTPYNITLPHGYITNSLAVHYLMYHRSEVPKEDIYVLRRLIDTMQVRLFSDLNHFDKAINGLDPRNINDAN